MSEIIDFPFSKESINKLRELKFGENWPVVYLLRNEKELYVGESSNIFNRMKMHLNDTNKQGLKDMNVIYDPKFNKSAILDIESLLIQYFSADNIFQLKNRNSGQSQSHDYYQRQMYLDSFEAIWKKLKKKSLVKKELDELRNLDIFKYSPYKTLTTDQYNTSQDILYNILRGLNKEGFTSIVDGGAGTGKTILAIYLMKLISDSLHNTYNMDDLEGLDDEDSVYHQLTALKNLPKFEFALVIPVVPLRKTLKAVFKATQGLSSDMVIGPTDVTKKDYDLLIVDEAHRLKRRVNLSQYASYDNTNIKLGLDKECTELDWILKCSKYQVFFYDESQSIKPTDVRKEEFKKLSENITTQFYYLTSQLRVQDDKDYVQYIRDILNCKLHLNKEEFTKYDVQVFDHISDLIGAIKTKELSYGLCRNIAGYSWKWKSKGMSYPEIVASNNQDITIEGQKFIWNTTSEEWVHSEYAIDEIGCIHTIQGYDLNYAGVIFGNEITYNENNKCIEIIQKNYFDANGKKSTKSEEELKDYIINIYYVLMTRGIRGTYIYACDEKLRKYLKQFF